MDDLVFNKYLHKIVIFDYKNGCIPANSMCYCYAIDGDYVWASFKRAIFGMHNVKLHKNVIEKHGRVKDN